MSYKVNLIPHCEYLEAEIRGERSDETSAQDTLIAVEVVATKCGELGLKKSLINWFVKGKMDKGQALIFMSNLEKHGWSKEFKTASVHHHEENYKSNSFMQTVANNLGWNVKFFHKKDEAMEWLFDKKLAV